MCVRRVVEERKKITYGALYIQRIVRAGGCLVAIVVEEVWQLKARALDLIPRNCRLLTF